MDAAGVLLVDDDEAGTELLKSILEGEGFRVETAFTGGEALAKFRSSSYNLVLLDFMLPDIKGNEVATQMRITSVGSKVILLTGYARYGETKPEVDYDDVLIKPVTPYHLLTSISRVLSGGSGPV